MSASSSTTNYKLVFFTPASHLEDLKKGVFEVGAGSYPGPGGYTQVCFTTPGISQFKPGQTSKPFIGKPGELEVLEEMRCEVLCRGEEMVRKAVEAVNRIHPYEEAVCEVYKMENF